MCINEQVCDLHNGYKLIQSKRHFGFTTDSVLLADFCNPKMNDRCVDLGAGQGIISVLLCAKNDSIYVDAVELQQALCDYVQRNTKLNNLTDRLKVYHNDLRFLRGVLPFGEYDLVVCNPPYKALGSGLISDALPRAVALHESGCSIADVIEAGINLLRFSGRLYLCHRPSRLCDIICLARERGGEVKRIRFVHPYINAQPSLVLIEIRRGGKPELTCERPLVLYGDKEQPTEEFNSIYGRRENLEQG